MLTTGNEGTCIVQIFSHTCMYVARVQKDFCSLELPQPIIHTVN